MSETPAFSTSPHTSSTHKHRGKRLRHFLSPEGKEVHIALSPEEAETLRQTLEAIKQGESFDLVLNGSPEHIEHLRRAHTHHERRRADMQAQYANIYDEWERLREDLDHVSSELHLITDHAVSLDANFSKYGYSAHLKTYDDTPSGQSSIYGEESDHDHKDWDAERTKGRVFRLYKKPVVRQYFHK